MQKFKSLETGAILVPNNKMVIEQLSKSEYYEEIKNNNSQEKKDTKVTTTKKEKDIKVTTENSKNK